VIIIAACLSGPAGCGSTPPMPGAAMREDGHRAVRSAQDREQDLANLRAEMAATKIAAAKKEAELQELRALVVQLRQENVEVRQAALESKRAGEAAQTEAVAVKIERDELFKKTERQQADLQQLTALQDTVAALSRELSELKQIVATSAKSVAQVPAVNDKKVSEGKAKRPKAEEQPSASSGHDGEASRVIPAMHIVRDDVGLPRSSRVTVQPGDTLWAIARRYQTTVEALRAVNGLPDDQVIAGKELRLP
jgi:LysM repeat protein